MKNTQPFFSRPRTQTAAIALLLTIVCSSGAALQATAQTFKTIYTFAGTPDASGPRSGVILDQAGNIYGTTEGGGTGKFGTAYKIDVNGQETLLHSFSGPDGSTPFARLLRDAAGNLYGTTLAGGTQNHGTVFKIAADGTFSTLYNFAGGSDAGAPRAGVTRDAAGNLYGATGNGGQFTLGTIFKIDASGNKSVLHDFAGAPDGEDPAGDLIRDTAGNIYGTTVRGGTLDFGTVFKIDANGQETILYSFGTNPGDGSNPTSSLVLDAAGNLYGTTATSVDSPFNGTVFKLDTAGNETVLKNFNQTRADGKNPEAGLVRDANGNLYGVCNLGGSANEGTLFVINASGKFRVLHNFQDSGDGAYAEGKLVLDGAGNLYGTTLGRLTRGSVFKVGR
ncbi:MAG: hypothetical protein LAO03_18835 [Acidobacteriia bacterium]|nr:hypothetical protein [Terriglobia bacterium]